MALFVVSKCLLCLYGVWLNKLLGWPSLPSFLRTLHALFVCVFVCVRWCDQSVMAPPRHIPSDPLEIHPRKGWWKSLFQIFMTGLGGRIHSAINFFLFLLFADIYHSGTFRIVSRFSCFFAFISEMCLFQSPSCTLYCLWMSEGAYHGKQDFHCSFEERV